MEMTLVNELTRWALLAVVGLAGGAFGLKKMKGSFAREDVSVRATQGEMSYLDRLEKENDELRKSEREAMDKLNAAMKDLGRLEAVEKQLERTEKEVITLQRRIEEQSEMIHELVKQNVKLLELLQHHGLNIEDITGEAKA